MDAGTICQRLEFFVDGTDCISGIGLQDKSLVEAADEELESVVWSDHRLRHRQSDYYLGH